MSNTIDRARESRKSEAEILSRSTAKISICGKEYAFNEPSRRQNRQMFGRISAIQITAQAPESRMLAAMQMLDFLCDYVPGVAMDENAIDSAVRAELGNGKIESLTEIVAAFREVATIVTAPFQNTAQPD
jgi:hypothetical protein